MTDDCGNAVCATKKVTVTNPIGNIFPSFTSSILDIRRGETIKFYDTSTPQSSIQEWAWYFELPLSTGNEIPGLADQFYDKNHIPTGGFVSHTYNTAGSFKIRLYATDDPTTMKNWFDMTIKVIDSPELISPDIGSGNGSSSIDENILALIIPQTGNQQIFVERKIAPNNWTTQEQIFGYAAAGWDRNKYPNGVTFNDVKIKDNKLMVMKAPALLPYDFSYQFFDGVGSQYVVRDNIDPIDEVPKSFFANSTVYPTFDFKNDEMVVLAAESTGTFIYLITRGVVNSYPSGTRPAWSNSTVSKIQVNSSSVPIEKIFIDDNVIVAHVNHAILLYEKTSGVWNFATQKVITSYSNSLGYHNGVIMAAVDGCIANGSELIYVFERPLHGWTSNQTPTAKLYLSDFDITSSTVVCPANGNSLDISDRYAVFKVSLTTGGTTILRKYIYKKWYNSWVDSNQTYKLSSVASNGLRSETSNSDFISDDKIYNYDSYCLFSPITSTTFSINGAHNDVINGLITLGGGGGTSTATINSGAKINYLGTSIDLKPGFSANSGSTVDLKAVATCDDLYFR